MLDREGGLVVLQIGQRCEQPFERAAVLRVVGQHLFEGRHGPALKATLSKVVSKPRQSLDPGIVRQVRPQQQVLVHLDRAPYLAAPTVQARQSEVGVDVARVLADQCRQRLFRSLVVLGQQGPQSRAQRPPPQGLRPPETTCEASEHG